MYLYAIISSLICIQLLSIVSIDANPLNPALYSGAFIQRPTLLDSAATSNEDNQNEIYIQHPRLSSFLRFGRQMPSASASSLRFGRGGQIGGQVGGTFLRFGRQTQNPLSSNFLLSGNKGEFLRFG
ncbi:unnamed protein product [Rotaria socialis]|uniref:Uncharacterized protein n=1 Tax=Rotaria socialis TaxID=392032 RepID=A0A818U849_9BILA|nr:unnamed protein product [Rotaria socialis]CAF3388400.1 unnamed protein product [Rotaria socialis]CAF3493216.1 unnamed protein product [Rotaria socialis]CAF3590554.1 unnamed protein product [Rotaria socialis]CAF3692428.1 unnamed protein product [Rotaria socialis]